jgi:hypothetical protein
MLAGNLEHSLLHHSLVRKGADELDLAFGERTRFGAPDWDHAIVASRCRETPMHVETFFVGNLGDLIRVRRGTPSPVMKAIADEHARA